MANTKLLQLVGHVPLSKAVLILTHRSQFLHELLRRRHCSENGTAREQKDHNGVQNNKRFRETTKPCFRQAYLKRIQKIHQKIRKTTTQVTYMSSCSLVGTNIVGSIFMMRLVTLPMLFFGRAFLGCLGGLLIRSGRNRQMSNKNMTPAYALVQN
jgi:hypothetical protein